MATFQNSINQGRTKADTNTVLGLNAAPVLNTTTSLVAIGYQASLLDTGSGRNVIIGYQAGVTYTTAADLVCVGYQAGNKITSGFATFVGSNAGKAVSSGANNTAVGYNGLAAATTGQGNCAVGDSAASKTNGSYCTMIGYAAGREATSGNENTYCGQAAGINNVSGASNTAIGSTALNNATTSDNTAVGTAAGYAVTSGTRNTSLGRYAQGNNAGTFITGNDNIAIGYLSQFRLTSGANNFGAGSNSQVNLAGGSNNVCLGDSSGSGLTSGSYNLFLGVNAGTTPTTQSSNIYLMNVGAAEANTIRIGTQGTGSGQQSKCWIAGIVGVTTDVNDAIPVLIDSTGQLGTVSSSIRYKENVNDMGALSDVLHELRPVIFNYKQHDPQSISMGLIAEEVAEVYPNLVVYDKEGLPQTVKYLDLIPMLLNEIQKLKRAVDKLSTTEEK